MTTSIINIAMRNLIDIITESSDEMSQYRQNFDAKSKKYEDSRSKRDFLWSEIQKRRKLVDDLKQLSYQFSDENRKALADAAFVLKDSIPTLEKELSDLSE